ncbi:MAG: TrkH family potassium uptake protein [Pseudomonadota bacterium]
MRLPLIARLLGIFLVIFAATLFPPAAIAWYTNDGQLNNFLLSQGLLVLLGLVFWLPGRGHTGNLRTREAFVVVTLFWSVIGLTAALPLVLGLDISITDAAFEAVSGFTTTGATVLSGLDSMPPSILMYRQQLQWLGGAGVIVLAIAILPMLGVGGMQLFRAETAGPMKDEKITPRITQTARALWGIYVGFTIACALAYWAAGMSMFDAVAHSFSTVSTAGFSTYDASLAYFDSVAIETIAIVFMLLGGVSFNVHFIVLRMRSPKVYWHDTQTAVFFAVVAALTLIIALTLYATGYFDNIGTALRHSAFQVASVITTSGFSTDDFSIWPLFLPVLLIFTSFIGGCAGSTAGGMKVIRFIILAKEGSRELWRLLHPSIIRPIKLGGRALPERVIDAVWGFFALYIAVFAFLMLLVMATGVDQVTAFGAVASALNNLGPGLGEVGMSFAPLNDAATWICTFAMLLGRLEIFTILALLSPMFWRK